MAILAYLRVSTDEQAQSGLGLEAQLEAITKAFGAPGAVYRDEGFSGSDPKRPGLLAVLDELKAGDTLAIAKRDRLARDVYLSAWIEKEVKKRRARIASAAGEGTEGDDPANVLMRQIVDAFAEYERAMIGVRTAAALAQKKARREYTGGKVPFGFDLDADGVRLIDVPSEQQVIAQIKKMRSDGLSLRQIGQYLQDAGIRTKQGRTSWNPKTVRQILLIAA